MNRSQNQNELRESRQAIIKNINVSQGDLLEMVEGAEKFKYPASKSSEEIFTNQKTPNKRSDHQESSLNDLDRLALLSNGKESKTIEIEYEKQDYD